MFLPSVCLLCRFYGKVRGILSFACGLSGFALVSVIVFYKKERKGLNLSIASFCIAVK